MVFRGTGRAVEMLEIEVKSSDPDGWFKSVNTGDLARKWRMISSLRGKGGDKGKYLSVTRVNEFIVT